MSGELIPAGPREIPEFRTSCPVWTGQSWPGGASSCAGHGPVPAEPEDWASLVPLGFYSLNYGIAEVGKTLRDH